MDKLYMYVALVGEYSDNKYTDFGNVRANTEEEAIQKVVDFCSDRECQVYKIGVQEVSGFDDGVVVFYEDVKDIQ
jgi:hypothetical protein